MLLPRAESKLSSISNSVWSLVIFCSSWPDGEFRRPSSLASLNMGAKLLCELASRPLPHSTVRNGEIFCVFSLHRWLPVLLGSFLPTKVAKKSRFSMGRLPPATFCMNRVSPQRWLVMINDSLRVTHDAIMN